MSHTQRRRLMRVASTLALSSLLAGCSTLQQTASWVGLGGLFDDKPAANPAITAEELRNHVAVLASDAYGGRLPGTQGETLTVRYLEDQFRQAGLRPGNPDGSYTQDVPLVGLTSDADVGITVAGQPLPVKLQEDVVVVSQRLDARILLRGVPLVFVGHGVQAPEHDWDDYAGLDVKGKILVMLVNDPQVQGADERLDPAYFRGRAMTYYGRWTYKYEIASKLGAAGALVIHNTDLAGYPWEVVSGSWGTENFTLDRGDGNKDRVAVEGWLHENTARELLRLSGYDYETLRRQASKPGFRGFELPAESSMMVRNRVRQVASQNVLAAVPGTDPALRDEWLIYTAHWDHLGTNPALSGDQIYNGALDNASGVAALIELAQAFAVRPARRSTLFLAVTAEEQGLLGARWYAENPVYPAAASVANINMDGLNIWGPTEDVVVTGMGQSTLEDVLDQAARQQGRVLRPESSPEKGYYFRSDHFELAKVGIPALYADSGITPVGGTVDDGMAQRADYVAHRYHKVDDELTDDWNLEGAVLDVEMMFSVGQAVANSATRPTWKPGSEFSR